MGKFTDNVLEWLKTKDSRGGNGCIKNGIWITLGILLVATVCIFTVCSSMPKGDDELVRLLELLDREFTPYSVEITEQDKTEFNTKVQNSAICSRGDLIVNGKLDVDKFLSSDTTIYENLSLTPKDLAILLDYRINENANVNICSASIEGDRSFLSWTLIFKLNITNKQTTEAEPNLLGKDIYVKFQSTIRKSTDTGQWQVFEYNIVINRLSGEDNEFAVNKLLSLLDISTKTLNEYALYPITFAKKQASIWNVNFDISADKSFVFSIIND